MTLEQYGSVVEKLGIYIENNLFAPDGIMYSGIDSQTDKPFDRDFITSKKVPKRAHFNPWAYWTYEDSVLATGLYLDALVIQYELTNNQDCLNRCLQLWQTIKSIYSCSQVSGIGSFLRPYGGYAEMAKFAEPLGTDQACPLFCGLYRLMKHTDDETTQEIARLLMQTLGWYDAQNYEYFYYKSFIHSYNPKDHLSEHANSYYLPAIAWAAKITNDGKWNDLLHYRLSFFQQDHYNISNAFHWVSLPVLADILGESFGNYFSPATLEKGLQQNNQSLATYDEPGERTLKRAFPESLKPGFKPYMDMTKDPDDYRKNRLGFPNFAMVHGGRRWPRLEVGIYISLALLDYKQEETSSRAIELLTQRTNIPFDFSHFISEDYQILPEECHLYSRSVGVCLVEWFRHYWLLKQLNN